MLILNVWTRGRDGTDTNNYYLAPIDESALKKNQRIFETVDRANFTHLEYDYELDSCRVLLPEA